jgi:hypothetical protein
MYDLKRSKRVGVIFHELLRLVGLEMVSHVVVLRNSWFGPSRVMYDLRRSKRVSVIFRELLRSVGLEIGITCRSYTKF